MDIKQKLANKYDNIAIYTSGLYADPEDELGTRGKLLETLKSLTMNQHADTPFSLQIMTTNGEINVMPLGLLSLEELKAYENEHRKQTGLNGDDDSIPLVVQFAPHDEKATLKKQVVGTTNALFDDFNTQFPKIWAVVKTYLDENQSILEGIEKDLLIDAQDVQKEYYNNFSTMTPDERQQNLGYTLKDSELEHFSYFMADMHEVQAVVMSAASFTQHEILGSDMFAQVMNDRVLRNTLFWVLDNTFYEIMYYFVEKARALPTADKAIKHLRHQKKLMIINMRNDAYQRAQKLLDEPQRKVDINHYFTDIFIPVAEQFSTELDKFTN
ncbi:hypothetical protein [Secundilactobacillus folii]|uniref:Uncharacterized protein n=1 Tax=Secundilactobacillus folii TaxID=2678357 RepID=A0A7X3C316_9LACO|nr:hypothetical protein [Secundilactobacillus folii]MTV82156.1 hypothetical protein [Secundilactobacillus folii]